MCPNSSNFIVAKHEQQQCMWESTELFNFAPFQMCIIFFPRFFRIASFFIRVWSHKTKSHHYFTYKILIKFLNLSSIKRSWTRGRLHSNPRRLFVFFFRWKLIFRWQEIWFECLFFWFISDILSLNFDCNQENSHQFFVRHFISFSNQTFINWINR